MAADYLEVQKQLEDMRNYKKGLEKELRQSELQMEEVAAKSENTEAKKFLRLQQEKVLFSHLLFLAGDFFPFQRV